MKTKLFSKAKRCSWYWGSHGCKRVKGHANRCRCICGQEKPDEAEAFKKGEN